MTIELIAVIEIKYSSQDVTTPDKYPYWIYHELWDKHNSDNYKKAGFIDDFKPYLASSSFYRLSEITDNNLVKLTIDHTQEMRDGKYGREEACAFFTCKENTMKLRDYLHIGYWCIHWVMQL